MNYNYPEEIENQNDERLHEELSKKQKDKLEWSYMDRLRTKGLKQ